MNLFVLVKHDFSDNVSNITSNIFELKDDDYRIWKKKVFRFHLEWMDIDFDIRKEKPSVSTKTNS